MKTYLFLFFATLISTEILASADCGTYLLTGKYVIKDKKLVYVVYEKTKSELTFEILKREDIEQIASFLDKDTQIKADLIKRDGTFGTLEKVEVVKRVAPDPLMFNSGDRMQLVTKKTCKN